MVKKGLRLTSVLLSWTPSHACVFNQNAENDSKLYTVDDRTGLVFEVTRDPKVVPRFIVMEGNGL
jgi:hypothetical protein